MAIASMGEELQASVVASVRSTRTLATITTTQLIISKSAITSSQ